MGARVLLELRKTGGSLSTPALLNGGFESETPCVLLPHAAAVALYGRIPSGCPGEKILTAGGPSRVVVPRALLRARVLGGDRKGPTVRVEVLISKEETEVLVSDMAIDALGVEILSHGKGTWRFSGERRTRPSEARTVW